MAGGVKESGSGTQPEAPAGLRASSALIPLQRGGSKTPLFIVHGVDGDVVHFQTLVSHLEPDQSVYGIKSQALLGERNALTRVEEMAAYYLKDIRRIHGPGPYHFLGFSFGGFVAFEMAQQLHARGEPLGLLAMLDTRRMVFHGEPLEERVDRGKKRITSHLTNLLGSEGAGYAAKKLRDRSLRMIYTFLERIQRPIPPFLQSAYDINWFAAVTYTPRPFPGTVLLLETSESVDEARSSSDLWHRLANVVEVREIPGAHEDFLKEPHVRLLAREVTNCLRSG
jgi:thioesterase domain-containing protein